MLLNTWVCHSTHPVPILTNPTPSVGSRPHLSSRYVEKYMSIVTYIIQHLIDKASVWHIVASRSSVSLSSSPDLNRELLKHVHSSLMCLHGSDKKKANTQTKCVFVCLICLNANASSYRSYYVAADTHCLPCCQARPSSRKTSNVGW